jgi:hypothetical protein
VAKVNKGHHGVISAKLTSHLVSLGGMAIEALVRNMPKYKRFLKVE